MRINLFLACMLLSMAVPGEAGRAVIDLSGKWQSSLGECTMPGTTDENRLGGERIMEGPTYQLTRLYPYAGVVCYEREFYVPESLAGRKMKILIERTKPSTLWIDDDSIGSISQLYAPHEYELMPLEAGMHHIRLCIDNRNESVPAGVLGSHAWTDATQTNWNGMLGRMVMEEIPEISISDMQIYPDVENGCAKVSLKIKAEKTGRCMVDISCDEGRKRLNEDVYVAAGMNEMEFIFDMGESLRLWSEFHPELYSMTATVSGVNSVDTCSKRFGMRHFSTNGTQFSINGKRTFLRGTHDGCVFPLTGYAPTDIEEWYRLFSIAKRYGVNHFRFHSYTPPEAAFEAADELGVYLFTELPMWGTIDSTTVELNGFLRNEAFTALRFLGNHPSFVGLGLGNELWGDTALMHRWLDDFRKVDSRHLYYMGANNDLGYRGPKSGEDFYVTCRVGNGEGFSTHARSSFSFADADHGGMLNWMRPATTRDFRDVVKLCPMPIVSHETCQFQIYPDYRDIPKYTGVLYPYNLLTFRDRLEENNLTGRIDDFHDATGRWAVECYKADMEQCLRTPGFGGYQLLDIKDYPGQGSALVGILDAFMESKGLVAPEEFSQWNSPVVPLALFPSHCYAVTDTLRFDIAVSNYSEDDFHDRLEWTFGCRQGEVMVDVPQGEVVKVAGVEMPLDDIMRSSKIELGLKTGKYSNRYGIWVYVDRKSDRRRNDVMEVDSLTDEAVKALRDGRTVLLVVDHKSIENNSVGGLFTPDYWNYAMFKTISENNKKPVSPGTLGMTMDSEHPVFESFPTEGHTDWQWWAVAINSRPLIFNALKDYTPIVQVVDNIERNHKLGILAEFSVDNGRLVLCTTDLDSILQYPEGRAYADAVRDYAAGDFSADYSITVEQLRDMLYGKTSGRIIKGVENITDYKKK